MAQAAGALSACLCGLECSAGHAVCFRQQQHEAQNRLALWLCSQLFGLAHVIGFGLLAHVVGD